MDWNKSISKAYQDSSPTGNIFLITKSVVIRAVLEGVGLTVTAQGFPFSLLLSCRGSTAGRCRGSPEFPMLSTT